MLSHMQASVEIFHPEFCFGGLFYFLLVNFAMCVIKFGNLMLDATQLLQHIYQNNNILGHENFHLLCT